MTTKGELPDIVERSQRLRSVSPIGEREALEAAREVVQIVERTSEQEAWFPALGKLIKAVRALTSSTSEKPGEPATMTPDGSLIANQENLRRSEPETISPADSAVREALAALENACERVAAGRSQAVYVAMLDAGENTDLLTELDFARAKARRALSKGTADDSTKTSGDR